MGLSDALEPATPPNGVSGILEIATPSEDLTPTLPDGLFGSLNPDTAPKRARVESATPTECLSWVLVEVKGVAIGR